MRKLLSYKLTSVLLFGLLLWSGFTVWDTWSKRALTDKQVAELEKKIENLEKENKNLEQSKDYFQSDAYLERQARLKLNYRDADEKLAFVYLDKDASKSMDFKSRAGILEILKSWRDKLF
jgi:cell division protein FtsL